MVIVLRTVQFRSLENIEGASVASKLVCHSGECELLANVRIITASFDEHWLAPATPALPWPPFIRTPIYASPVPVGWSHHYSVTVLAKYILVD